MHIYMLQLFKSDIIVITQAVINEMLPLQFLF